MPNIEEILEAEILETDSLDPECEDDCTYKGLEDIVAELEAIKEKLNVTQIALYQSLGNNIDGAISQKVVTDELNLKQPLLECGLSIKTINGECLLGPGNIEIDPVADCPWRVGDVLPSFSNINPSAKWAGTTWELACKGRAIMGVDPDDSKYEEAGLTFGAKTHALTVAQMPKHRHKPASSYFAICTGDVHVNQTGRNFPSSGGSHNFWYSTDGDDVTAHYTQYTDYQGSGNAFDLHQPSITLYMWRRTS